MPDIVSRYRETSIDAATKAKLVQMLLGRAMQHARAGAAATLAGRIEVRFQENQRLAEIVSVLREHLDLVHGGAIARQLDMIYGHIQAVIIRIDIRGQADLYDHVLAILADLERAWAEIVATPTSLPIGVGRVAGTEVDRGTASQGSSAREGFSLRA